MILGGASYHAGIFDEIDRAVTALLHAQKDRRVIYFNAHIAPNEVPPDGIVFNLENVGIQIPAGAFPGRRIWDFSRRNVARWRGAGRSSDHVPVSYHAEMTTFSPRAWKDRDVDVVFAGSMNARRVRVIAELRKRGLRVEHLFGHYGSTRDAVLARSKIALNMLYFDDAVFPVLRYVQASANHLPIISEQAPDTPSWVHPAPVPYGALAEHVAYRLAQGPTSLDELAQKAFAKLAAHPMTLPAG